jgi:glycosyltransferase involved in cell wall biosynthesis
MEIYGDMLTIMQAFYHRMQSDRGLETQIAFLRQVLRKGDIFSGCGRAQCHMLVGELAMAGRLNRWTFGYEFTRIILPGSPPAPGAAAGGSLSAAPRPERHFLAQHGIGDGDFVVLWCGGYNTWTDVDTLFGGLEAAMQNNPQLHYVSVGANTYSAPDNVYERLTRLVANSPFAHRYHLLGWRPWSEMASFYRESDVGINIDALHYETIFGTRTRLVEMIAAGLPVVTSLGAELSYLLRDAGAALAFSVGDAQGLGQALAQLAGDDQLVQRMARAALHYARNDLSFATTTQPLAEWVAAPAVAPDRQPLSASARLRYGEYRARSVLRQVLWRVAGADR